MTAGWWIAGVLATVVSAGCAPVTIAPAPAAPAAPAGPVDTSRQPSSESRALSAHYAAVDAGLRARGLMRTDDGRDVPVSAEKLAENFLRIALYDEFTDVGGTLVAQETAARLRRWEQPVRVTMIHGASTRPERASADQAELTALTARLSRATGHPIRMAETGGNFTVLVLDEDERRDYGDALSRLVPGISASDAAAITLMPKSTFCVVLAFSAGPGKPYTRAVAVIRAEHPPGLRSLCLHEEVAQGLGLANDAAIRPSIFNDDEEFALLTRHDELLLKMLYDPRLRVGMSEAEARPIAGQITSELLSGKP
ncbi:MAG: DUF2927 domain-containing protein [Paracoccaceae bacterium]